MMKRLLLAILLLPPAVLFAGQVAQIGIIGPIAPKVTVSGSVNTPQIAVIGTKPLELKVYTPTATTANVVIPGIPGPPGKDGASGASTWNDINGKPATFPPSAHNQSASTITGLSKVATSGSYSDLSNLPDTAAAGVDPVHFGDYSTHRQAEINDKEQVGVANALLASHNANGASHSGHFVDTGNPHATTAAQVGAPTLVQFTNRSTATKVALDIKVTTGSDAQLNILRVKRQIYSGDVDANTEGSIMVAGGNSPRGSSLTPGQLGIHGNGSGQYAYFSMYGAIQDMPGILSSTDVYMQIAGGNTVKASDLRNHLLTTSGNPHNTTAAMIPGLATVATSGSYTDLINQPTILRGYDGREIELRTNATHIQWRYLDSATWTDLTPLSAITGPAGSNGTNGTNGDTYVCAITGGIRSLLYDKDSHNPTPAMVPFGVEVRKNGTIVTPDSCTWSVPASGSLLSGSSTTCTFTPTVNSLFSAGSADNRVDVVVTYSGITCRATAPVPATRVGDTGAQGSPDTKTDIYGKIGTAVNGDVLNTQAGSGDADSFAFRTVRAKGGDIHRTDLAVGQTWIHARPTDAATAPKLGIKNSSGTPVMQFNADGSFTGTLVIR